jgi:simple sugar transport system substrate-binding protein
MRASCPPSPSRSSAAGRLLRVPRATYVIGRTPELCLGADDRRKSSLDDSGRAATDEMEASMSDEDNARDVIERLEWADGPGDDTPGSRWRQTTRRTALSGGAAGLAALLISACGGGGGNSASASATNVFGKQKKFKFTVINHVTTNPFFVPTKFGAADACSLLGCSFQWTGSQSSNVNEMVNAMNSAISAKVDGIAVSLIDEKAFNAPTQKALAAGIPVVAYNADSASNARLAYIGQDLFVAGQQMGQRIVSLVGSGDVALFIATPGAANIQPRINGAISAIKQSGAPITAHTVATGAAVPQELTAINSYWVGHTNTKGLFAVDGGSTQGVAQTMQKHNLTKQGVKAGGFDLLEPTIQLLAAGQIDFTIDQQPYLQGFLPILELFLYKASGTLSGTFTADTGLKFLTQQTVQPYVTSKSRFEGSSTAAGVTKA